MIKAIFEGKTKAKQKREGDHKEIIVKNTVIAGGKWRARVGDEVKVMQMYELYNNNI